MSIESDINDAILASDALTALIGTRFSWDIAEGSTVAPFLVAQTISTDSETTHDGDRSLSFPLIQFSCWAKTKAQAIAVMSAFKTDIEGVTLPGASETTLTYAGENSSYDSETKLFGHLVDYRAAAFTN